MKIAYKYLEKGDDQICNFILRSLPAWFGIEEAILDYVAGSKDMEMLVACDGAKKPVGFISIKLHNEYSAEIYVMGVLKEYQYRGIGPQLVKRAEKMLKKKGVEFFQVKTLSPSRENWEYSLTRKFYLRCGFRPIEEFKELWGKENPCLLMIKKIS